MPLHVLKRSGDDVVHLVVIMAIDCVAKRWAGRGKVEHSGGRDTKLAVAVHTDTELKGIADRHHALIFAEAAPEVHIREDNIDAAEPDARGELVVGYQTHIGSEGNVAHFSDLAHAFEIPGGIFQVLQVQLFCAKPASNPKGSF